MIMYLGRVMEFYTSEGIYADPKHPYTQALLSAIPPESPFEKKERRRRTYGGMFLIRITCLLPSHAEFSVQKIPIREKQLPNSFTAEYFHKGVM